MKHREINLPNRMHTRSSISRTRLLVGTLISTTLAISLACSSIVGIFDSTPSSTAATTQPEQDITQAPAELSSTLLPKATASSGAVSEATRTVLPPMPKKEVNQLRAGLKQAFNSPYWPPAGLTTQRLAQWTNFAQEKAELNPEEELLLKDFLAQWDTLTPLAPKALAPDGSSLAFKVVETADPQGGTRQILCAIDANASVERLFLGARNADGEIVSLILAPEMPGFRQEPGQETGQVAYIDEKNKTIILADGRKLGEKIANEKQLKEMLAEVYGSGEFVQASIYPRFRYAIPGIEAGFYAIEKTLSYTQLVLLRETLELFERPRLEALRAYFFSPDIAYVIYESIQKAAGLTYTGTRVIGIDRKDLFGNKYHLASVLAHEGAHVLQGSLGSNEGCRAVLKREVGDNKIPEGFYKWSAEELVSAIEDIRIGAYHVSLWMLTVLGVSDTQWLVDTIRTGKVNGQWVVFCQP